MKTIRDISTEKQAATAVKAGQGLMQSDANDILVFNRIKRIDMAHRHSESEYNAAAEQINEATAQLEKAIQKLMHAETQATEKAKQAIARSKDSAAQIGDALNRVNRILGPDFELRLAQLERVANSLSKLAELEKAGVLRPVLEALKGSS